MVLYEDPAELLALELRGADQIVMACRLLRQLPPVIYFVSYYVLLADTTAGAAIHYTTDGSTPTTGSQLYSAPFTISASTTVKAIATASGYTQSAQGSASYTYAPVTSGAPGSG